MIMNVVAVVADNACVVPFPKTKQHNRHDFFFAANSLADDTGTCTPFIYLMFACSFVCFFVYLFTGYILNSFSFFWLTLQCRNIGEKREKDFKWCFLTYALFHEYENVKWKTKVHLEFKWYLYKYVPLVPVVQVQITNSKYENKFRYRHSHRKNT